ncbi:MAG: nucleoside triphosphate pyrophosphohydrolase [Coriobacteriales bacterium]|nr:nucleoside triphosphate pyrophosphohydrolase [Coriobacteriales bacterium]
MHRRRPVLAPGGFVSRGSLVECHGFDEFVRIIAALRAPDGCPWDREQTHSTIAKNMVEEAYEAVHAIEEGDDRHLVEELGDVLLQVVLQAQIGSDDGSFTIDDVVGGISEKIVRRHPHVFGDAEAGTSSEVHATWDRIKRDEKAERGAGLLDEVPSGMPALMQAQTISRKAVSAGFEWETLDDIWEKVHEEIDELKATEPGSAEAAGEIGDLLFTVVNLARKQGIDAETALRATNRKFRARWSAMEAAAAQQGVGIATLSIDEQERLWQQAKERERDQ